MFVILCGLILSVYSSC